MKILFFFIYVIAFLLLSSSCGTIKSPTYGPVNDENFKDVFLNSVQINQQEILFYSRAIWYPNKNGFKFLPAGKSSVKGVLVCTNEGIYFAEWKANGIYNAEYSAKFNQIEKLRLAANELFGRVVIKNDNYNSFEILGIDGADIPNKEQTEIAFTIIQIKIEG